MPISLREITKKTVYDVTQLSVSDDQSDYVAPNAMSLAQALFNPEAYYRAIYADETLVGFIMLYDETQRDTLPKKPEVDIWRFMIDKKHQNKGYGRRVLEIVISELKARQCFESVKLSYVPGNDSAVELYKSVGFVETGEIEEGEVIMSLNFQSESHK